MLNIFKFLTMYNKSCAYFSPLYCCWLLSFNTLLCDIRLIYLDFFVLIRQHVDDKIQLHFRHVSCSLLNVHEVEYISSVYVYFNIYHLYTILHLSRMISIHFIHVYCDTWLLYITLVENEWFRPLKCAFLPFNSLTMYNFDKNMIALYFYVVFIFLLLVILFYFYFIHGRPSVPWCSTYALTSMQKPTPFTLLASYLIFHAMSLRLFFFIICLCMR